MPKFVIEREMPGVGDLAPEQMKAAAQKSSAVMRDIGSIHWVQSYVADDKMYCVYVAPDAETIRRHAREAGLPANKVMEIHSTVDATTAEEPIGVKSK